jgi:hypothetical protein
MNNLILKQTKYKMFIPKEVENKIRLLLDNIRNIEWSGVLFYDVEGSFEDNSLKVICKDILPMDIGNATYTEWDMNADVVSYIVDHPELVGSYQGLVHSHHAMSTFFSGTDTNTLKEEGSDVNHFVSLIVNNAGTYNAAITRKVDIKNDVYSVYTYKSFGDIVVEGKSDYTECNTCIEYFYLDIEVEKSENNNSELFDRISKLKESKNKSNMALSRFETSTQDRQFIPTEPKFSLLKEPVKEPIQKKLFTTDEEEKKLAEWYVKQLLTCNVMFPEFSNLSIEEIASKIKSVCEKRFKDIESYESFMSNFIDFIIYDFTERLEELRKEPVNPAEAASLLFDKILPLKGSYINILTDFLEAYI